MLRDKDRRDVLSGVKSLRARYPHAPFYIHASDH